MAKDWARNVSQPRPRGHLRFQDLESGDGTGDEVDPCPDIPHFSQYQVTYIYLLIFGLFSNADVKRLELNEERDNYFWKTEKKMGEREATEYKLCRTILAFE